MCTSTFAKNVPRILSPSLCPIVYNNIAKQDTPGYNVPNPNICGSRTEGFWTEADSVNTYQSYERNNNKMLDNSKRDEDVYLFLNSCNQKPLYNGSMEKVKPFFMNTYNSAPVDMNPRFNAMNTRMENVATEQ
jgi:hypothetical protein